METTNKVGAAMEAVLDTGKYPSVILVGKSVREGLDIEAIRGQNTFYKQGNIGDTLITTFCDLPLITLENVENDFLDVK